MSFISVVVKLVSLYVNLSDMLFRISYILNICILALKMQIEAASSFVSAELSAVDK